MKNALAYAFVLVVLSACGAHVYTHTTVRPVTQMRHTDPLPYWHVDGSSIRGLDKH